MYSGCTPGTVFLSQIEGLREHKDGRGAGDSGGRGLYYLLIRNEHSKKVSRHKSLTTGLRFVDHPDLFSCEMLTKDSFSGRPQSHCYLFIIFFCESTMCYRVMMGYHSAGRQMGYRIYGQIWGIKRPAILSAVTRYHSIVYASIYPEM